MSNRSANTGQFRKPGKVQGPSEKAPSVTHIDLSAETKPTAQRFAKPVLSQERHGQQRRSPGDAPT